MENKTEDLFQEILNNARSDREKVQEVRDELLGLARQAEVQAEGLAMVSIAENVARLSDVLTKSNAQLVELAKIRVKSDKPEADLNTEKDSLFDEIESTPGSN